jgi:SAM-dependent methyltransferase
MKDFMFSAPGEWTLKGCPEKECALAWLDPFPKTEDLGLAYQSYYTHEEAGSGGGGPRQCLYAAYRFAIFLPAWLVGLAAERERLQAMFLKGRPPGRLLDVGCGDGGFLFRMKQNGWEVQGVDFDAKAIANAKVTFGLQLQVGDLRSARFPDASFDAVTMNHVIEHVPDPVEEFRECYRVLKPGGILVVLTPNIQSLGHEAFGPSWRGLEPPRHLHIFSVSALRAAAIRAGLEIVEARSSAANADIIGGASFSIQASPDHRISTCPPPSLKRTLQAVCFQYREHFRIRSGNSCGEEAVLVCRRRLE